MKSIKLSLALFAVFFTTVISDSIGYTNDTDDTCADDCIADAVDHSGCNTADYSCQCTTGKTAFVDAFKACSANSTACGNITVPDPDLAAYVQDRCNALVGGSNSTSSAAGPFSTLSITNSTVTKTGTVTKTSTTASKKSSISMVPSAAAIKQEIGGLLAGVVGMAAFMGL